MKDKITESIGVFFSIAFPVALELNMDWFKFAPQLGQNFALEFNFSPQEGQNFIELVLFETSTDFPQLGQNFTLGSNSVQQLEHFLTFSFSTFSAEEISSLSSTFSSDLISAFSITLESVKSLELASSFKIGAFIFNWTR